MTVAEIEESNVTAQDLDPTQVLGKDEHRMAPRVRPHEAIAVAHDGVVGVDQIPRQGLRTPHLIVDQMVQRKLISETANAAPAVIRATTTSGVMAVIIPAGSRRRQTDQPLESPGKLGFITHYDFPPFA
jgi:hypothetical protein